MTDKIYTDEKIIHDLNCYENLGYRSCGYAIDLINRQKAEIDRLESLCEKLSIGNDAKFERICVLQEELETARAEAIEEFAERLKAEMDTVARWQMHGDDNVYFIIGKPLVDKIVKELTEGKQ